jgi:hypothetical protein
MHTKKNDHGVIKRDIITLSYEHGTIVINSNFKLPHTVWDTRVGCYRCSSLFYKDVLGYLNLSGLDYVDNVM